MRKQDGVYTRTAAALEQKNSYGKRFAEILKIADDARAKVNSVESSVATIRRTIDQNRSAIELLVVYDSKGNPTASGSFIIEAINGASSAKIAADRLDIDGKQLNIKVSAANIVGTFTVKDADGKAILNAGNNKVTLSGWDFLSKSVRYNNLVFGKENSYVLYPAGSSSSYTIAGTNRSGWKLGIGQNFGVAGDGYLYCKNADITGKITATSGSFTGTVNADKGIIGGWTLGVTDRSIYDTTALYTESAVDYYYNYIHPQGVYVVNGDKSEEAEATWYQIARTAQVCFNQASDTQLITFVDKNNLTHNLIFSRGILVSYTRKEP